MFLVYTIIALVVISIGYYAYLNMSIGKEKTGADSERLKKIIPGAEKYVEENYVPIKKEKEEKSGGKEYTYEAGKDQDTVLKVGEPRIRYSKNDSDIQFSINDEILEDRYDPVRVNRAMRGASYSGDFAGASRMLRSTVNNSFTDSLLAYIGKKNLRYKEVYTAARIDRKLFSKITSDRSYTPSKDTCIALAMALNLNPDEAAEFLSRAGFVLSHSIRRDVIIEYFFREGEYSVDDLNTVLYQMGEKTLGRTI
ncbi:MAG: hypothetical protein IJJ67_00315 [Oscillospiraceae bacterium]|nr:hypothetical protein [Oscillospiraceae bacterium]